MKLRRSLCLALAIGGIAATGNAGTLYTFGGDFISPDATGAPTSLNSMDPASAASVTDVQTPVGTGDTGFNGGLVAANSLLYAIGNDSNNFATLYSFDTNGLGLSSVSSNFNTTGDATGFVFQNGLTAIGNTFYAIGADSSGEALFQIGAGSATQLGFLNTFTGTFAGLAWDTSQSEFYAIIAGASSTDFNGDFLVKFALGGPVQIVANLTSLDGAEVGTHLGGLADAGGGILYSIYTNPITFTGELEQINLNGSPSAVTLYDSGVPLAQNAGIAIENAAIAVTTPEPATTAGIAAALLLFVIVRRPALRKRQS